MDAGRLYVVVGREAGGGVSRLLWRERAPAACPQLYVHTAAPSVVRKHPGIVRIVTTNSKNTGVSTGISTF